ncbi:MAG: rRNA maturation RNase YbeY [Bdellovibrionota bacterium]
MKRKWNVLVENKTVYKIKKNEVKKLIKILLNDIEKEYKIEDFFNELSVSFFDNKKIKELNRDYRGKDIETDVLSFANIDDVKDANKDGVKNGVAAQFFVTNSLGDIAISLETAEKQAKRYKTEFNEEIVRLLTHGVLHLVGFEHEKVSKKEKEEMFNLQDKLVDRYFNLINII